MGRERRERRAEEGGKVREGYGEEGCACVGDR